MRNPPSLNDCRSEKGEAVFQKAIEYWLEKALLEYLPAEVLCLVPAPLLPDSSGLSLPVPYLGRAGSESSYKGIARFGVVTALFQKEKASLYRLIHEYYGGVEPVIVKIRKDDGPSGIDPGVDEVGKFCLVSVPCSPDDQPHPGDPLTGGFISGKGKIFALEPGRFQPDQAALREEEVPEPAREEGDAEIGGIVDKHIRDHSFYVPTLAPILHHAQVVMVLARSIHDDRWEERRKFGAGGVTFLLAPDCRITEDLAIRLCAVAQRVDGLLGSLHFAIEDVTRAETTAAALGILKHSVVNNLRVIGALASHVAPHLTILTRCLHGALAYARRERTSIIEEEQVLLWRNLGYSEKSFDQTIKDVLWAQRPQLSFEVDEILGLAPDSRVLVMVEELARNLAKGLNRMGRIKIQCNPKTGIGHITVEGWGSSIDLDRVKERLQSMEPAAITVSLRGLRTIIEIFQALQDQLSAAEYVLGEDAIRRFHSNEASDFTHPGMSIRMWTQDSYDSAGEFPFLIIFKNLKLAIP